MSRTPVKRVPIHLQSAQSRIFIKNGMIVNDDQSLFLDLYIEDGVIKQMGANLVIPGGARTIDARGKLIIPGGIDTHTHFQQPSNGTVSADDFYSGTKAALSGGTTMIIDYVVPENGESLIDAYDRWREMADSKACCDFAFHMTITYWSNAVEKQMEELMGERGVNAFKVLMAPSPQMLEDPEVYSCFKRCKQLGAVPLVHAENGHLIDIKAEELIAQGVTGPEGHLQSRPEEFEEEATQRAITIADQARAPLYVVRVSSKSSANVIAKARKEGKIVFGEPTAASLGTDGSHQFNKCWRHAAGHVTSPPLRADPSTPGYLMGLLANNDLQVTASDNKTFNADQKALGKEDFRYIPQGINGVEDRMSIIWEKGVMAGIMDPNKFVAVTSTNAAKIFNLYPKKGRIAVGSDADLVIWNGESTRTISAKTHHQAVDFNVFEGEVVHGVPEFVISAGHIVMDEGQLKVTQGLGRFTALARNPPYVYGLINIREKKREPKKVDREGYSGPVVEVKPEDIPLIVRKKPAAVSESEQAGEFHSRPPTRGGVRNMQDSSFSLSGQQIDDNIPRRSVTKVSNPPGGRSTSLW